MSFDVIFTKSAEAAAGQDALPELEERTRDAIAELPGQGIEALRERLFHAFRFDADTDVICSLTDDGTVRIDACAVA